MERGPPRWFYCFAGDDELRMHFNEFADLKGEFAYWGADGAPFSFDDPRGPRVEEPARELLPLVTSWLIERGRWQADRGLPSLVELPGLVGDG